MPISFSQVVAAGDVLSADRHVLYFPTLPIGGDGNKLTLRHTTVTLPPWDVGQIVVKLFGWPLAFAGRRNSQNQFQCSFVETVDSPVLKTLVQWQSACAPLKEAKAMLKSQYAVSCKLVAYDTTGKEALTCMLYNVWPQTITPGGFEETSNAWHHDVAFSVDAVDIVALSTSNEAFSNLSNMAYSNLNTPSMAQAMQRLGWSTGLYNTPSTVDVTIQKNLMISAFF